MDEVDRARLREEPLEQLRGVRELLGQHLDRDPASDLDVDPEVDPAHSTAAEQALDAVASDQRADERVARHLEVVSHGSPRMLNRMVRMGSWILVCACLLGGAEAHHSASSTGPLYHPRYLTCGGGDAGDRLDCVGPHQAAAAVAKALALVP